MRTQHLINARNGASPGVHDVDLRGLFDANGLVLRHAEIVREERDLPGCRCGYVHRRATNSRASGAASPA